MTQKTDNEENSTNSQVRRTKITDEYDEANGAKKNWNKKVEKVKQEHKKTFLVHVHHCNINALSNWI